MLYRPAVSVKFNYFGWVIDWRKFKVRIKDIIDTAMVSCSRFIWITDSSDHRSWSISTLLIAAKLKNNQHISIFLKETEIVFVSSESSACKKTGPIQYLKLIIPIYIKFPIEFQMIFCISFLKLSIFVIFSRWYVPQMPEPTEG